MRRGLIVICIVILCCFEALASSSKMVIHINLPEFRLRTFRGDVLIFEAPIGVGRTDAETPIGEYTVINKIVNPTWYPKDRAPVPPGPTNPLGKYWLGLSLRDYGIHGNINSASIGTTASAGCIRMHNDDVEFLFNLIELGTRVVISYNTVFLEEDGDNSAITIVPDIYGLEGNKLISFLNLIANSKIKEQIFIPQVSHILQNQGVGRYPVPFKVTFVYEGQSYQHIGYREGETFYIDPRALDDLVSSEPQLVQLVTNESQKRYFSLNEIQSYLLNYQFIILNNELVKIQANTAHFQ